MPRAIDLIVVHCADTPNGKPFHAADIDRWHRERGFRRSLDWIQRHQPHLSAIGYHYVICADGRLEEGRNVEEMGAHAQGQNDHSIGISLIGADRYSAAQWTALHSLLTSLTLQYPGARVIGHREVSAEGKTCPGFDVQGWLADPAAVEAAHQWPPALEPVPAQADAVAFEEPPTTVEESQTAAAKSLFRSKTFWGAVIAPLAPLLSKLGVQIGPADLELYAVIAVALAGVALAIWGRFTANTPVKVLPKRR